MSASDEESFEDVLAEKTILIDKEIDSNAKNADATGAAENDCAVVGADMSFEEFDFSEPDLETFGDSFENSDDESSTSASSEFPAQGNPHLHIPPLQLQLFQKWSMDIPEDEDVDGHTRNVNEYIDFLVIKYGFEILKRIGGAHKSGQVGSHASDLVYLGQVAFGLGVNVEHV